ncbi:ATP-binding protein [Ruminococcus sp. 5_1_39BFAA]|uniref:sensor histidine kinase n=1 Tax=Ruminococcus sp. 5_1_39BFAA TaxID=457412 RepID=UPI003567EF41
MRHKILNHTSFMVVLTVLLTFVAASLVMYNKFNTYMKQGVRDETEYVRIGVEEFGEGYLTEKVGDATASRITLTDGEGNVLFDSSADADTLSNHSDRPEFIQAVREGYGEKVRFSETLSKQTFYYAVKLENGDVLRVAKTTDSVFLTLMSSFTLLGLLMIVILLLEFVLGQRQTEKLIQPINDLDLEHPLDNICYEELRPLLKRVDQQNRQIAQQVKELKAAESARREFTANVSHELKTPLMSISGYAELMMNGMVKQEDISDFSGRIYHEANRLTNLVADIIQLSRMDENSVDMPFEAVDIYELAEDVVNNLKSHAEKKKVFLTLSGESVVVQGVRQILYEMIYNIADNAVRYTEAGGMVKVSVGKRGGKSFYRVEDTGIGIPKAEQNRIFERFYRVDKSHSRQTGGTGLGLSIVKHGVQLHKARIFVDSEPGKGTRMEIWF